MILHDFQCHPCNVIFEDVSEYRDGGVVPVDCPQCGGSCGIVWLKSPGMAGDGNLTAEEKVAVALKMGIRPDGKMVIPQTRADVRKIKSQIGDFPVGSDIVRPESKRGDIRSTSEKESDKAKRVDFVRERRAKFRAGLIPKARTDRETVAAMKQHPISDTRILSKKGA